MGSNAPSCCASLATISPAYQIGWDELLVYIVYAILRICTDLREAISNNQYRYQSLQHAQQYQIVHVIVCCDGHEKAQKGAGKIGEAENHFAAISATQDATGQLQSPMHPIERAEHMSLLNFIPMEAMFLVIDLNK